MKVRVMGVTLRVLFKLKAKVKVREKVEVKARVEPGLKVIMIRGSEEASGIKQFLSMWSKKPLTPSMTTAEHLWVTFYCKYQHFLTTPL